MEKPQVWSNLSVGEADVQLPGYTTPHTAYKNEKSTANDSWKVVGSPPSRRGSLSAGATQHSPPRSPMPSVSVDTRNRRRSSLPLTETWASFGTLQWEGSSLFDEPPSPAAPDLTTDPLTSCASNSVLSVPMLPSVPLEPIYRQHRSYSFSVGQEPSLFGYDDYSDELAPIDDRPPHGYRNPLATMEEEEEGDHYYSTEHRKTIPDKFHSRSQSSSTVSALLARRRASEQLEDVIAFQGRRPSLGTLWGPERTDWSQPRRPPHIEYAFPGQAPNATNSLLFRNELTEPSAPVRHIMNELKNTHLRSNSSDFHGHLPLPDQVQPQSSQESDLPRELKLEHATRTQSDLGKGVCLHRLPESAAVYMVEFKAGRTDFFYVLDSSSQLQPAIDDLMIVEADRGKDLGKVATTALSSEQVILLSSQKDTDKQNIQVKRIFRQATPSEVNLLLAKAQDEQRALMACQQKVKHRNLPMEVVDAEFQWDRRKLTYYFTAEKRIDFRELVRELFKIYKTRIWMCAVNPDQSKGK